MRRFAFATFHFVLVTSTFFSSSNISPSSRQTEHRPGTRQTHRGKKTCSATVQKSRKKKPLNDATYLQRSKYLQLSLACPTYHLQTRVSRERFAQNEGGPCQRTAITNQSQAPGGGPTLAFINVQTKLKGPVTSQSQRQRMELSNLPLS